MGDVVQLDPRLARFGVRAPRELDGVAVVRCIGIRAWPSGNIDASFELLGGRVVWAATERGSASWTTILGEWETDEAGRVCDVCRIPINAGCIFRTTVDGEVWCGRHEPG